MTKDDRRSETLSCPVCKKEAAWKENPFRPFCSERCRLIDLGKWAAGEYRVPTSERPAMEGDKKDEH